MWDSPPHMTHPERCAWCSTGSAGGSEEQWRAGRALVEHPRVENNSVSGRCSRTNDRGGDIDLFIFVLM